MNFKKDETPISSECIVHCKGKFLMVWFCFHFAANVFRLLNLFTLFFVLPASGCKFLSVGRFVVYSFCKLRFTSNWTIFKNAKCEKNKQQPWALLCLAVTVGFICSTNFYGRCLLCICLCNTDSYKILWTTTKLLA